MSELQTIPSYAIKLIGLDTASKNYVGISLCSRFLILISITRLRHRPEQEKDEK
jgi:hypothetical protein